MSRHLSIVTILIAFLFICTLAVLPIHAVSPQKHLISRDELVQPREESSYLWPYTSKRRDVSSRTLRINVIVPENAGRTRTALTGNGTRRWNSERRQHPGAASQLPIRWHTAQGSVRYTYLTPEPNHTGQWIRPKFQLEQGTYFGARNHMRVYGRKNWTALQIHREYWDWFRLSHTVTGVSSARNAFVRDARESSTINVTAPESDDGESPIRIDMVTASFAVVFLFGGWPVSTEWHWLRNKANTLSLLFGPAAIYLGVCACAIFVGSVIPTFPAHAISASGYLVIAIGLPVVTYHLSQNARPRRAFALVAMSLIVASIGEFLLLGVRHFPQYLFVHRVLLGVALGSVAVAGNARSRHLTIACVFWWGLSLALPLFGYL